MQMKRKINFKNLKPFTLSIGCLKQQFKDHQDTFEKRQQKKKPFINFPIFSI